jgi:hypothetical protein
MNARTSLIVLWLLACSRLLAQPLPVRVQVGSQGLDSERTTVLTAEHGPLVINTVRFYLSELRLMRNGTIVWRDTLQAHLIDLRKPEQNTLSLPDHQPVDSLYFRFGTDSLLNVSGALSGDLDPSKGMYWAWNSGYINCKIEGRSERSVALGHQLEYHLGGYLPPNTTSREVRLPAGKTLVLDLQEFLESIKPGQFPTVTAPGPEAVRLCEVLARSFRMVP